MLHAWYACIWTTALQPSNFASWQIEQVLKETRGRSEQMRSCIRLGNVQLELVQFPKGLHCHGWILITSHGKAEGQGTDHLQQLRARKFPWISNSGGDWKANARTSALGNCFKIGERRCEESKGEKTVLWTTLNLGQVTAVQRVKNFAPRVILASFTAHLEFDDWSLLTIALGGMVGLKICE